MKCNIIMLLLVNTFIRPSTKIVSSLSLLSLSSLKQQQRLRGCLFGTSSCSKRLSRIKHFSTNNSNNESDTDDTASITSTSTNTSTSASSDVEGTILRKKRIAFLGTPDVAATTLKTLYDSSMIDNSASNTDDINNQYEIICVITQPPKRRQKRKGSHDEITPVHNMAQLLNIPYIRTPIKLGTDSELLNELLLKIQPDLCITVAYGQYLTKQFLSIPKYGTINIHPSLVPKYRGSSPVQRSLQSGDNPIGVSILYTVSKMDAGPIIAQQIVPLATTDSNDNDNDNDSTTNQDTTNNDYSSGLTIHSTTTEVLPKLFEIGTELLLNNNILQQIFNKTITIEKQALINSQNETNVSQAPLIKSYEGQWNVYNDTAIQCYNKLRAFSIWPNCYIYLHISSPVSPVSPISVSESESSNSDIQQSSTKKKDPIILKVKIIQARLVRINDTTNTTATTVPNNIDRTIVTLNKQKGGGLYITCYDNSIIELLIVQPATKNQFTAKDLYNGYPNQIIRWIYQDDVTISTDTNTTGTSDETKSTTKKAKTTTTITTEINT